MVSIAIHYLFEATLVIVLLLKKNDFLITLLGETENWALSRSDSVMNLLVFNDHLKSLQKLLDSCFFFESSFGPWWEILVLLNLINPLLLISFLRVVLIIGFLFLLEFDLLFLHLRLGFLLWVMFLSELTLDNCECQVKKEKGPNEDDWNEVNNDPGTLGLF